MTQMYHQTALQALASNMGLYFRRALLSLCRTLNILHLLRRLMFDAWGELIEASIVTKHIILIHERNTNRLLVSERRNKKERKKKQKKKKEKKRKLIFKKLQQAKSQEEITKKNRRTLTSQRQSIKTYLCTSCVKMYITVTEPAETCEISIQGV